MVMAMPFVMDTNNRRIMWSGPKYSAEATNSVIAYRLSDRTVIYAEAEWRSSNGYNESINYFVLNAVIELMPDLPRTFCHERMASTGQSLRTAMLLGLKDHWSGQPAISLRLSGQSLSSNENTWHSDEEIVDRWVTTRQEAQKIVRLRT
jgi:hypothetical protein